MEDAVKMEELGLPFGHAYFPFCDIGSHQGLVAYRCSNVETPHVLIS
ncbi:MAG: hypothetical protein JKX81_10650 [Arenicella sp.]|nr:hypothetical protein [Arenicella sp.]